MNGFIKSFASLHHWLMDNNIDPNSLTVTISAPSVVRADQIGRAIGRMRDSMAMHPPETSGEPIHNGSVYGIRFVVSSTTGRLTAMDKCSHCLGTGCIPNPAPIRALGNDDLRTVPCPRCHPQLYDLWLGSRRHGQGAR